MPVLCIVITTKHCIFIIITCQCYDPVLSKRTALQESPHIHVKLAMLAMLHA